MYSFGNRASGVSRRVQREWHMDLPMPGWVRTLPGEKGMDVQIKRKTKRERESSELDDCSFEQSNKTKKDMGNSF